MKGVQYIKWKNEIVGILQTNEEGIKYVPNMDNIEKLKKEGIPYVLITESNDGSVPKFIENRLKLNSKKDSVTVTDHFSIVRA